ncbi:MAG: NAD(+) diphosphatase [Alphaproteobacteria bacterium]|nr:NAD(+) diphosphatase [Alphaproteobacteria bacterium]MDE2162665.1 NAD(+) diphosphatase [Alphaproteobacteria bacterium]MDE2266855.1 NAD(+) diphosphatase [Alphaproteobacteria bacterium]
MIAFAGNPLNRLSEKRPDTAWIAERLRDPASLILPVWRLQPFMTGGDAALQAGFLRPGAAESLAAPDAPCIFLGLEGARAMFARDISAAENPQHGGPLAGLGEFRELRGAAPLLPAKDLAILGQAKAMIDWHQRHGFCARCGAPSVAADAGYKRVCTVCGTEHFPRTDPAVIMLATQGDACLLGRNKNWPPDFYSALAGFLEPGESIEEAVCRELFEEAGVRAGAVRYYASQPWPFPSQLMIGCFAECESRDLVLDANEIAEAEWFTRERARALLAGALAGRRGPFSVAIAHHLIRAWIQE